MALDALRNIRRKYPQYADVPDQELARKILAKYPEYDDLLGDVAGPLRTRTSAPGKPVAAPGRAAEAAPAIPKAPAPSLARQQTPVVQHPSRIESMWRSLQESEAAFRQPATGFMSELSRAVSVLGAAPRAIESGLTRGEGYRKVFERAGIPERGAFGPAATAAFLASAVLDPALPLTAVAGRLAGAARAAKPLALHPPAVRATLTRTPVGEVGLRPAGATRFPPQPAGIPKPIRPSPTEAFKAEKFGESAPVIREAAEQARVAIAQQRRGIVSDAEVKEFADMIGIRADELARLQPGTVLNAENIHAARSALKKSADSVYGLAEQYARTNDPATLAQLETAYRKHLSLQIPLSGVASETGRALRQFRLILRDQIPAELVPEAAERPVDIAAIAAKLVAAGKERAAGVLGEAAKPTFGDMLAEAGAALKMSGPVTQLRNTLGNTFAMLVRVPERAVAGIVDPIRAAVTRTGRERFVGEAAADVLGKLAALKDASRNWLRAITDEQFSTRVREIGRVGAIPGRTGRIIRIPFRFVSAMDEFFLELNRRGAIYAESYRTAIRQGPRGALDRAAELARNPSPEMMQRAEAEATEYLFQKELGDLSKMVQRARDNFTVYGVPLGRIMLPFFRTPVNLIKFVFERSPLGVLSPRNIAALKAGGGEASDAIARVVVGSAISAAVVLHAAEGNITGGGPRSRNLRDQLRATGWQPYSIKIGNRWVSHRGFDPLTGYLNMAASLVENIRSEKDTAAIAEQMTRDIARNVKDQSYLQGLADILEAIDNPGGTAGSRFAGGTVTGFIPRALDPLRKAFDPTVREFQTFQQRALRQIPVVSRRVSARLDPLGREIWETGGPLRGLVPPQAQPKHDVLDEFNRLGVAIPQPGKAVRRSGQSFAVPEEERRRLLRERGRIIEQNVPRLAASPAYRVAPDELKKEMLERFVQQVVRRVQPRPAALVGQPQPSLFDRLVAAARQTVR